MLTDVDRLGSIPLDRLVEGMNRTTLTNGRKAIVIKRGGVFTVIGELCPHMGADLAESRYCAADRTLACPWHGYIFSVEDGSFVRNPNEDFMKVLRVPSECFKPELTPKYRLQLPLIGWKARRS